MSKSESRNWRYQGLISNFLTFVSSRPDVMDNQELREKAFDHVANKIYDMGYEDARKDYDPKMYEVLDANAPKKEEILN